MKRFLFAIFSIVSISGAANAQTCERPSPFVCPSLYSEDCATTEPTEMAPALRAACIAINQGSAEDDASCASYDAQSCNAPLSASKTVQGLECRAFKLHYSSARGNSGDSGDATQNSVNTMYNHCRADGRNIFSRAIDIEDGNIQLRVVSMQDTLMEKLPEDGPKTVGSATDICGQQIQGFEQVKRIEEVRAEFENYKTESQELFTCSVWFEKMKDCILDIEQAFADHSTGVIEDLPIRALKWQAYEEFADGYENNTQRFETMLKQVETRVLDLELQKDAMECR